MQLSYTFEPHEIELVGQIVASKLDSGRRFVQFRLAHNVEGPPPQIDDDGLWAAHIMCLLTTQQRSGPGSATSMLLEQKPSPLSLERCRSFDNPENSVIDLLTATRGIRRTNRIAKAVQHNLHLLEQGEWDKLREWRDALLAQRAAPPDPSHRATEEAAADYMNRFLEFGPKQSRNFWQSLGLTRYTFVLDSRILRWMRQNLNMEAGLLTPYGLGDVDYYRFISNIFDDLCRQAHVLPCMFDVAVFDSFDEGTEWREESMW